QISLLMMRVKALSSEHNQWENRNPELVFDSPNVLLSLGKEELQNVKEDLEMLLSAVQAKNKQLEEDLEREQQWEDEQKEILHCLAGIKEEIKKQVEIASMRRSKAAALNELQSEVCTLQIHKEKLLTDFAEFLGKHFPHPEKGRKARNKIFFLTIKFGIINFYFFLNLIFQVLMNKLLNTPHEPYVMITDSFWPPYIELLLRYGIARRHPEDASRIRLEAFH
ncbi:Centromere protein K, partial [Dryobates pubescens]